jgi:uncharacterized protein YjiS (DUF1127 family)
MSSLSIGCPIPETYPTSEAADAPPWWARLTRLIADEYRVWRGTRELLALDDQMLRDIGLDRGSVEYVARFGRA